MSVSSRVQAVFSANSSGLVAGTKRASNAVEQMSARLKSMSRDLRTVSLISTANLFANVTRGAVAAANGVRRLANEGFDVLSGSVQKASALSEQLSKSSAVFGVAAKDVEVFARSASDIGLSTTAALEAASSFGALFRSMGRGAEVSAEMSVSLTKLAADLSSFYDKPLDQSITALGAAIRGESEPIRAFGVLLNEATLRKEAFDLGLTRDVKGALDPTTRALAAYAATMRQTALAQGNFAQTSEGLANLQRVIQARIENLQVNVGAALEPVWQSVSSTFARILDAAMPVIREIAEGIKQASDVIAKAVIDMIPEFEKMVGAIDGKSVGESIRDFIFDGVDYLLQGAVDFGVIVGKGFEVLDRLTPEWREIAGSFESLKIVATLGLDEVSRLSRQVNYWEKQVADVKQQIAGGGSILQPLSVLQDRLEQYEEKRDRYLKLFDDALKGDKGTKPEFGDWIESYTSFTKDLQKRWQERRAEFEKIEDSVGKNNWISDGFDAFAKGAVDAVSSGLGMVLSYTEKLGAMKIEPPKTIKLSQAADIRTTAGANQLAQLVGAGRDAELRELRLIAQATGQMAARDEAAPILLKEAVLPA